MRSQLVSVWTFAVLAGSASVGAQERSAAVTGVAVDTVWYQAPALFPMMIEVPANFDPSATYPAVVALHGFGSSATDFRRISSALTEAGFISIVPQGPYVLQRSPEREQFSWGLNLWTPPPLTDDPEIDLRSTQLTAFDFIPRAVEVVAGHYRLGNVYVLGFSQGAVYAFGAGFYSAELFSGIVVFGLAGFSRDWATMKGGVLEDSNHLPVFIGLGDADTMVPFEDAERMHDLLAEAGYEVDLDRIRGGARPSTGAAVSGDCLAVESRTEVTETRPCSVKGRSFAKPALYRRKSSRRYSGSIRRPYPSWSAGPTCI